jgi:hypothetical protein
MITHVIIDNWQNTDYLPIILQILGIIVTICLGFIALIPTIKELPCLKIWVVLNEKNNENNGIITVLVQNYSRRDIALCSFALEMNENNETSMVIYKIRNLDESKKELSEGEDYIFDMEIPKCNITKATLTTFQTRAFKKNGWFPSRSNLKVVNRQILQLNKTTTK